MNEPIMSSIDLKTAMDVFADAWLATHGRPNAQVCIKIHLFCFCLLFRCSLKSL